MAAFNVEIVLSRPFGRWDLAFMVEIRGGGERVVRGESREEGHKPQFPTPGSYCAERLHSPPTKNIEFLGSFVTHHAPQKALKRSVLYMGN